MDPYRPITVYKASAGSGKTFTLALEYIRLLLGTCDDTGRWQLKPKYDNAHRSVLAITFTNKATNEMKVRIVSELAVLAGRDPNASDSAYLKLLKEMLNCTDEKKIADIASQALTAILEDYGFFNISTIDAFFQSVLRTFAREANLIGNYEIDLDKTNAYRDAVDELLTRITRADFLPAPDSLTDKKEMEMLRQWVVDYMIEYAENGRTFNLLQRNSNVRDSLCRFLDNLTNEEFERNDKMQTYLEDIERLTRFRDAIIKERERLYLKEMPTLLSDAQACGRTLLSSLNGNKIKWLDKTLKELCKKIPSSLQNLAEATDGGEGLLKKSADLTSTERQDLATLQERAHDLFYDINRYAVLGKALESVYRLGLLSTVRSIIAENMSEKTAFLLSDTNAMLRQIIGDDDAPFVYERMGLWLNHFLVDEFQDTSQLQWDNLKPLFYESVGNNNANLIIGDEKQCIYRWRGSKPELLTNVAYEDFRDSTRLIGNNPEENTNWRSSADIVHFNNALFKEIATRIDTSIYSNVEQNVAVKNRDLSGYVVIRIKDDNVDTREQTVLEQSFEFTVQDICRQLDAGYKMSDIAVLFRKTSEASDFINYIYAQKAATPQLKDLRIVSEDSMRIDSSPAVNRVVNLIRFMVSSDYVPSVDNYKRKKSQRDFIAFSHNMESAIAAGTASHADFYAAVNNAAAKSDLEHTLQSAKYSTGTLSSIVRKLIMTLISPEDRKKECAYLEALEDLILDYSSRPGGGDFAGFVDWWDKKGCRTSVSSAGKVDALTVMTIHKSKGLEFTCVHIPVLDPQMPNDDVAWFETKDMDNIAANDVPPIIPLRVCKEMDHTGYRDAKKDFETRKKIDEINVLYVALTRARRELSVFLTKKNRDLFATMVSALDALSQAKIPTADKAGVFSKVGENSYVFGQPTKPAKPSEKTAEKKSMLEPTETETFVIPEYNSALNPYSNSSLDLNTETP